MENGKHIWIWVVIFMVAFWTLPIFITADQSRQRIHDELQTVYQQFGETAHNNIVDNANKLYQSLIIDTGIQQWVSNRTVTDQAQKATQQLLGQTVTEGATATNSYLSNTLANWYGLTLRVQLVLIWIPLILPFLLGAVIDGYVVRKIKLSSIGFFSSNAFSATAHILIFICCLPVLYLIAPMVMSPFWIPAMAIAAAIALRIFIRNAQRFWD